MHTGRHMIVIKIQVSKIYKHNAEYNMNMTPSLCGAFNKYAINVVDKNWSWNQNGTQRRFEESGENSCICNGCTGCIGGSETVHADADAERTELDT